MMCQQSYGFLPCTTTVLGNLFLMPTYGFLMYKGATYLSHGSELLLEIMGPGLVAGLLVPLLGVIPEALTVLGSLFLSYRLCFVFTTEFFMSFNCSCTRPEVCGSDDIFCSMVWCR